MKKGARECASSNNEGLANLRNEVFNLGVNKERGQEVGYKIIGISIFISALLLLVGCANQRKDFTRGVSPVCQVHGTQMAKTNVPIVYGLYALNEWGRTLEAARTNSFPNAEEVINAGCIVGNATQAVIYVCSECQAERRHWISEHPKPRNYTEKSVAGEWIGLDQGWSAEVFRLILKPDGTGVLTEAPNSSTNSENVYRYEINHWYVATNDLLKCEFNQRNGSEPLKLSGTFEGQGATSFSSVLHNGEGGWRQSILFWRARDLDEKIKTLRQ